MKRTFFSLVSLLFLLSGLLTGCKKPEPETAPPPPPEVTVVPAIEDNVADDANFPCRVEAVDSVEVRARVTGYLEKVLFIPGAEVKEGDQLFLIDPLPYEADLERAEGQVAQNQAKLDRVNRDIERNRPLVGRGVVTGEEFDKLLGEKQETEGTLKAARANLKGFQLNVQFTRVKAPVAGKVGRSLLTVGNLVKADVTVLTTIVSTGKMHVYFDVDENAYLRYQEMVLEGKTRSRKEAEGQVELTLANGKVIKGGTIDFLGNQLDRRSGTIEVRAVFPDPDHALTAGGFGRLRLPLSLPHKALLIPEKAVGSDQGRKYVFVIDDKNMAHYVRIELGPVYSGMQAVEKGLKPGDRVVVRGLQRVRDGAPVTPKALAAEQR